MGKLIDETGNVYGHLTVLKRADNIITPNGRSHVAWLCKCDCGNEIITTGKNLRNGMVRSCGCLKSFKESEIALLLINNKIKFSREYSFSDLKDLQPLRFDFAIFNAQKKLIGLIEYNGEQHYLTKERGRYTIDQIEKIQQHDKMKKEYCKKHNISLLILNKNNYSENLILNWIKNIIRESEGEKTL